MRCTNSTVAGALHMALNSKLRNQMPIVFHVCLVDAVLVC